MVQFVFEYSTCWVGWAINKVFFFSFLLVFYTSAIERRVACKGIKKLDKVFVQYGNGKRLACNISWIGSGFWYSHPNWIPNKFWMCKSENKNDDDCIILFNINLDLCASLVLLREWLLQLQYFLNWKKDKLIWYGLNSLSMEVFCD